MLNLICQSSISLMLPFLLLCKLMSICVLGNCFRERRELWDTKIIITLIHAFYLAHKKFGV